ncbi:MAG: epoxyalkane--coenzyme M transferase [Alphaproteobacteria bacterium]|nr:epoxyalkane--coenzyme M transferase [Alphaproteobacteria bacterium]
MQTSTDRILTTHVGSMPRPEDLADLLYKVEFSEPYDHDLFERTARQAVVDIVAQQRDWGFDIINDGEMAKTGYATYIQQRLDGFSGESASIRFDDMTNFPEYRREQAKAAGTRRLNRPCCTGAVTVRDRVPLERDIENLKSASADAGASDVFMNAASPGVITVFQDNQHYPSDEAYLQALADVMREEYEAIVEAGFILQIDCPDLAMGRHTAFRELSDGEFLAHAAMQIEALNSALENVAADRVRMHICWGNYEGPHHRDIPLAAILDEVLKAKPMGLLIEASNPRHAHEWSMFAERGLPEDKVLIPGVIDSVTNYIEHPELVAQRICQYADVVGRERVIAGADCGFATFAGMGAVDAKIAVEKFKALTEGAEIASKKLWGG